MDLKEYLNDSLIPYSAFARKAGISPSTLDNIIYRHKDMKLSIAMKIEKASNGKVTCQDLYFNSIKKKQKSTESDI
jgi:DNA-binding transcriptional regulator YdaS (Cro superfamily)